MQSIWRRGRDSNPRYPCEVHTLSRRARSTTPAPLQFYQLLIHFAAKGLLPYDGAIYKNFNTPIRDIFCLFYGCVNISPNAKLPDFISNWDFKIHNPKSWLAFRVVVSAMVLNEVS